MRLVMKRLLIKILQFTEHYIYSILILTGVGVMIVWDYTYLDLGQWEVLPRSSVVVLSMFAGLINLFRTDNKILFKVWSDHAKD